MSFRKFVFNIYLYLRSRQAHKRHTFANKKTFNMNELKNIEAEILQLESDLIDKRQRLEALKYQLGQGSHRQSNCQSIQTYDSRIETQHLRGLKKIFDAIPEPIMIINRDFTVAMANRIIWESTLDSQPGQCPTCHQLTHNLDRPCSGVTHPCPVQEVLRTKSPSRVEHVHYDKNGRALYVEIIAAPIFDENENIVQIIEICRDVSDRKWNEIAISNQLEFLKTLVETIPSPIFYKDAEGVYLGCNTAFEKVLGLSKEAIVGKTAYEISPKELADRYHAADRALMENKGTQEYEAQVLFSDNSLHEVVFNKATYMKSDGSVGGLVGVMVDITSAKRTAKALEKSVSRFNAFMDNLPALAFVKDQYGKYVYLNRAVESFYNQTAEQRLGKTDYELWPSTIAETIVSNDQKVLTKDRVLRTQENVEIEGRLKHHLVVKFPITEENQPSLLAGVAIDITDWRESEKEREALQRRLETSHRMEALGTLAGGIAHDFNNILTAILGYAELAAMSSAQYPDIRNYLTHVLTASNRAKELVSQILAFSRQSNEQPRPVIIRPIVEEALKLIRATLPTTIRLEHNLDSNGATMADPTHLHQIVMNLCTNANYAMKDGGGTLKVNLSTMQIEPFHARHYPNLAVGHYIRLTVGDTGIGISPKDLEHIFEPFYSTKSKEDGSGMGLSVVHGIVKSCNGTISVKSKLGEGSCFEVYLPRIEAEILQNVEEESQLPIGRERILFVDDEKMQTELAGDALSRLGYDATTFTDSTQALSHFIKHPDNWDLVITDMSMPGITGDVLGRQIKSIRPDMRMIICTGYSETLNEERAKEIGFSAFILKPLIIKELARLIRRILDQSL